MPLPKTPGRASQSISLEDNLALYVTRFLSFTVPGSGRQGRDTGKQGLVCRFDINTSSPSIGGYQPAEVITLAARKTGFAVDSNGDGVPDETAAFPNQLQSIVIRGNRAFLPNIAGSPQGPLVFNNDTQAFLTVLNGVGTNDQTDGGSLNLHLGARDPEAGKKKLNCQITPSVQPLKWQLAQFCQPSEDSRSSVETAAPAGRLKWPREEKNISAPTRMRSATEPETGVFAVWMTSTTLSFTRSTTETFPETKLATHALVPSELMTSPCGFLPALASRVAATLGSLRSI